MALWVYLLGAVIGLMVVRWIIEEMTLPANVPPVYREFPYIPWLGSLVQFAIQPREFLQRAHAKMGDVFTVNLFGWSMTFLMSSEGHSHFFKGKEDTYDIREAYKCTVVTFGPDVVYDCPVKKMGEQLGFLKTGLTRDKYHSYVPAIQEEVVQYFESKWGDAGEGCLFEALSELFTLTSARCLLGPEIRARWSGEFAKMYFELDHSFIPITFFFPNMPNPSRSKCVNARNTFEKIFAEVVERRRAEPEGSGAHYDDFLQVLMDTTYRDGSSLTMKEITGIMVATLLGGQHTSNVTGTWAMCHLFKDRAAWGAVMAEQRKLLDNDLSGDLILEDVEAMTEFDKVLNETLRLHPPFFQLARVTAKPTEFNGYAIPAGRMVAISPGAAQRLPSLWSGNPDEFDLSRWEPENREKHIKNSWIPFGGGRHMCSGRKFAETSLKTALSWLMRNYEMEFVNDKIPKEDYTTMVVAPVAPVTVRYKRIRY